ncbi:MAG: 30S ribosome-binding factor RbfA [Ilumatobacteraceae bacterium]
MARNRRRPGRADDRRRNERNARMSETLREVIADELAKLDDDRLQMVTVTAVDVDSEMNHGVVYFDSMEGVSGDEKIIEALNEYRKRIQHEIALQVRSRRTPVLEFKPDETMRAAARIDEVLREDARRRASGASSTSVDSDSATAPSAHSATPPSAD